MQRLKRLVFVFATMLLMWGTTGLARSQKTRSPERPADETPSADETIFSGPQVGETLPSFVAKGAFDEFAGKEVDYVDVSRGRPIVLIFVHDVNRQSISLARILATYTNGRAKDGLVTGMVLLHDDPTEAETTLKRMRHAIGPLKASVAKAEDSKDQTDNVEYPTVSISQDGREGPGSYGLNRNVTLTILVGKDNKVAANFALVQPSLQVDLPKILESVVAVAGGTVPNLEDLEGMPAMQRREGTGEAPNMRPLLTPVIRRDASDDDVIAAAKKVEEAAARDEAVRKEVGRIANTIINAGKLKDYGTAKCQEYLSKWATEYGDPNKPAKKEERPEPKR